ncbi:hypothetical protein J1605_015954 [Eschrichtius robustus]|uniref:Uncharacterized protein n=1 Tax=Eschrichtius robustus TaxID=9764 RepID=A0AB34GAW4_ESCRO|nr:hypothetical protein J1605_015954 [Eschrichtius robustus]
MREMGSHGERQMKLRSLAPCCAARFLTGRAPGLVHGPGVEDPWSSEYLLLSPAPRTRYAIIQANQSEEVRQGRRVFGQLARDDVEGPREAVNSPGTLEAAGFRLNEHLYDRIIARYSGLTLDSSVSPRPEAVCSHAFTGLSVLPALGIQLLRQQPGSNELHHALPRG